MKTIIKSKFYDATCFSLKKISIIPKKELLALLLYALTTYLFNEKSENKTVKSYYNAVSTPIHNLTKLKILSRTCRILGVSFGELEERSAQWDAPGLV